MSMQELDSDASVFVVNKLQELRESFEAEDAITKTVALVLVDVVNALGLLPEERQKVLGPKLARRVDRLLNTVPGSREPMLPTPAHAGR